MAGRLHGKVAVVTGGCSGIGLATVERFVEEGARVVIADIDDERGHVLVGQLGGEEIATFVSVDVTDKEQVDALFATAKERYGSVDVAFNNAGICPPEDDSILDTDLEAWRRVQEVNLTSVYLCCKAALPHMLEQRSGSIINTASFVAVMGAATSQISYSASKGGVLSMRPTAYAPDGILEAMEDATRPFWLAVQWHPETQQDHGLFAALVAAAAAAR